MEFKMGLVGTNKSRRTNIGHQNMSPPRIALVEACSSFGFLVELRNEA
jgi:hypothetical protein